MGPYRYCTCQICGIDTTYNDCYKHDGYLTVNVVKPGPVMTFEMAMAHDCNVCMVPGCFEKAHRDSRCEQHIPEE